MQIPGMMLNKKNQTLSFSMMISKLLLMSGNVLIFALYYQQMSFHFIFSLNSLPRDTIQFEQLFYNVPCN